MKYLVAICGECGALFRSRFSPWSAGYPNQQVTISSDIAAGPCPICGEQGHIPAGEYTLSNHTHVSVQGPPWLTNPHKIRRIAEYLREDPERGVVAFSDTAHESTSLIHFTGSADALFSILRYGFLFLHNETRLLNTLFGHLILPEAGLGTGGMVCFTDLPLSATRAHQNLFGSYGIAVRKGWAIERGASRVAYIDVDSHAFDCLRNLFRELLSREVREDLTQALRAGGTQRITASLLATNPTLAAASGYGPAFSELLRMVSWMQTAEDLAQSEWRVRSPYVAAALTKPDVSRSDLIKLLIERIDEVVTKNASGGEATYDEVIPPPELRQFIERIRGTALTFGPSSIEFVCVPASEVERTSERLLNFTDRIGRRYQDIRVVSSDAANHDRSV
jgi:hypothetical protein